MGAFVYISTSSTLVQMLRPAIQQKPQSLRRIAGVLLWAQKTDLSTLMSGPGVVGGVDVLDDRF